MLPYRVLHHDASIETVNSHFFTNIDKYLSTLEADIEMNNMDGVKAACFMSRLSFLCDWRIQ